MAEHSQQYFIWFPEDQDRMRRAHELAASGKIRLPNGDQVSPSILQSLGHLLGACDGAKKLHWLLEHDPTSNAFRHDLAALLPFQMRNPLYSVIHESSMADGVATAWAAARVRPDELNEDPLLLTGEHLMPSWFDELSEFRPWAEVANAIAEVPWPKLYHTNALRESGAKGAAAVYFRDAFVPLEFSLEAAELVPGVKTWVTSQYEHNGLRASGGAVLQYLIELCESSGIH